MVTSAGTAATAVQFGRPATAPGAAQRHLEKAEFNQPFQVGPRDRSMQTARGGQLAGAGGLAFRRSPVELAPGRIAERLPETHEVIAVRRPSGIASCRPASPDACFTLLRSLRGTRAARRGPRGDRATQHRTTARSLRLSAAHNNAIGRDPVLVEVASKGIIDQPCDGDRPRQTWGEPR